MKTKIKELIIKYNSELSGLEAERNMCAKLNFNAQCVAISNKIDIIIQIITDLKEL